MIEQVQLEPLSEHGAHAAAQGLERAGSIDADHQWSDPEFGAALTRLRAGAGDPLWLLAHCDDGVIWGIVEHDALRLPMAFASRADVAIPRPRAVTIQQLRIFGSGGELLVWRNEDVDRPSGGDGSGWLRGRLLLDQPIDPSRPHTEPKPERWLLFGDSLESSGGESAFAVVAERRRRRVQVVPVAEEHLDGRFRVALNVKHYFECDGESGCVRRAITRLVSLEVTNGDLRVRRGARHSGSDRSS